MQVRTTGGSRGGKATGQVSFFCRTKDKAAFNFSHPDNPNQLGCFPDNLSSGPETLKGAEGVKAARSTRADRQPVPVRRQPLA